VRSELLRNDESLAQSLLERFERAQDARARLEVAVQRSEEAMTESQREVSRDGFGDQMSRMLFGGLRRRDRGNEKKENGR